MPKPIKNGYFTNPKSTYEKFMNAFFSSEKLNNPSKSKNVIGSLGTKAWKLIKGKSDNEIKSEINRLSTKLPRRITFASFYKPPQSINEPQAEPEQEPEPVITLLPIPIVKPNAYKLLWQKILELVSFLEELMTLSVKFGLFLPMVDLMKIRAITRT